MSQAVQFWNQQGSAPMTLRTGQQVVRLFDGTDLVEPGVVSCSFRRTSRHNPATHRNVITSLLKSGGDPGRS
jgi:hypothetical protein